MTNRRDFLRNVAGAKLPVSPPIGRTVNRTPSLVIARIRRSGLSKVATT